MHRGDGTSVARQEVGRHTEILHLIEHLQVLCRHQVGQTGGEGKKEADACRERKTHTGADAVVAFFPHPFGVAQHARQSEDGEQRQGELCHHEGRGDGAELGIHRQMVDEEVGEGHGVFSPSKGEREEGGGQERPLHRSAHDEEGEHGEKDNDCAHIDRSDGHGLVAPILRHAGQITAAGGLLQLRGVLVEVVVAFEVFDALAVHNALRTAAFEVGHEEGERLVLHDRRSFRELLTSSEEGISAPVLSRRLADLVEAGFLTKTKVTRGKQGRYSLTERGLATVPLLIELGRLGAHIDPSTAHNAPKLSADPEDLLRRIATLREAHAEA